MTYHVRPFSRAAIRGLLILALSFVAVACASKAPSESSAPRAGGATSGATSNDSSSQSWLSVGSQIISARASQPSGAGAHSFGPYLTNPVTISGPGQVLLTAGPLRADDNDTPSGISFPPDITFDPRPLLADAKIYTSGTDRYVQIPVDIANVKAPYVDLRAWIQ